MKKENRKREKGGKNEASLSTRTKTFSTKVTEAENRCLYTRMMPHRDIKKKRIYTEQREVSSERRIAEYYDVYE
jgi:hypothetical protein